MSSSTANVTKMGMMLLEKVMHGLGVHLWRSLQMRNSLPVSYKLVVTRCLSFTHTMLHGAVTSAG